MVNSRERITKLFFEELEETLRNIFLDNKEEWGSWGNELAGSYKSYMGKLMQLADQFSDPIPRVLT